MLTDGEIETLWGPIELNPPKLIVGLSLTLPDEATFPGGVPTLPAILDTGFNRTLEIDEQQLTEHVFYEDWLDKLTVDDDKGLKHKGELKPGNRTVEVGIWLHREPYESPWKRPKKSPVPLSKEKLMRVIPHPAGQQEAWPPLPLLGLEALTANGLYLSVNGPKKTFRISRGVKGLLGLT